MTAPVLLILGFLFAALASQHIGKFTKAVKLPMITGYLLAGAIVGPFVLGWITQEDVQSLRIVDHLSLAFIAFAAGNELYFKEIRSRLKSIVFITSGLVFSTFTLGTLAVMMIADYIPFIQVLPFQGRLAVAFMAAAILVARSPSSAIAIINELRARGPYTKTTLGVTVVMDAIVIVLFAIAASISQSLTTGASLNPLFFISVLLDLFLSLVVGCCVREDMGTVTSFDQPGFSAHIANQSGMSRDFNIPCPNCLSDLKGSFLSSICTSRRRTTQGQTFDHGSIRWRM